ncbi:MAG: hypothetical protein JWO47_1084 [Candidatus Saccharibacteria bacterium]|nr:hypothetical protein [Candidatus Saccharibacteria bacterium]
MHEPAPTLKSNRADRLKQVARTAYTGADNMLNGRIREEQAAKERAEQQRLKESREKVITKPAFAPLRANLAYRDWLKKGTESRWANPDLRYNEIFATIRDDKPVNPYDNWHTYLSESINKDVSDDALHESAVKYSNQTARSFVGNATRLAQELVDAKSEYEDDPKLRENHMRYAIAELLGISNDQKDETIFKDFSWSATTYTPDFAQLGVGIDELDVPAEQIMAGVGLAIGLWVNLADMGATRPVSGHKFGPPFRHCSFTSLVMDSGWAGFSNVDGLYRKEVLAEQNEDSAFLDMFREPDFFEVALAELQPAA